MKQPKKRRVVYLIPNILTTGNLFSGLASIFLSLGGIMGRRPLRFSWRSSSMCWMERRLV